MTMEDPTTSHNAIGMLSHEVSRLEYENKRQSEQIDRAIRSEIQAIHAAQDTIADNLALVLAVGAFLKSGSDEDLATLRRVYEGVSNE